MTLLYLLCIYVTAMLVFLLRQLLTEYFSLKHELLRFKLLKLEFSIIKLNNKLQCMNQKMSEYEKTDQTDT